MSSFICSAKHFNSIESGILKLLNDNTFHSYALKEFNLYSYDAIPKTLEVTLKGFMGTLKKLNVLCVSLQYRKDEVEGTLDTLIEDRKKEVNQKTNIVDLSKLGLYNALKCLVYQVEIEQLEDIRDLERGETKAMLFLETFINCLANHICGKLPEDETNKWSID